MISELLKQLMKECGLSQKVLAETMGVPLQRVKHLTAGNVQKLTREESAALIQKLGVRANWLITGEGAMLGRDETQDEFARRMRVVNDLGVVVDALPLAASEKVRTKALLTGAVTLDAEQIARALKTGGGNIVDVSLVVRIAAAVETTLTQHRARIPPAKKEELVKLLYDHFSAKGRFEEETVERHLKLVINH